MSLTFDMLNVADDPVLWLTWRVISSNVGLIFIEQPVQDLPVWVGRDEEETGTFGAD